MTRLIITFLIFISSLLAVLSQNLNLQVGNEFEYWESNYVESGQKNNTHLTKNSESYTLRKFHFTVLSKNSEGYQLNCKHNITDEYSREMSNEQWETVICNHTDLHNKFTSDRLKSNIELIITLSQKGTLDSIIVVNSSGTLKTPEDPQELKRHLYKYQSFINMCFSNLTSINNADSSLHMNGEVYQLSNIDKNHYYFNQKDERFRKKEINHKNTNTITHREMTIRKDGLLKEAVANVEWTAETNETYNTFFKNRKSRIVYIKEEPGEFDCKFNVEDKLNNEDHYTYKQSLESKAPIRNTNVCIRGKVHTPNSRKTIRLVWIENSALNYKKMEIEVPLEMDSTFEIKLHIDKISEATLIYLKDPTFYLMPGDDIYIDINSENEMPFNVKGIGANHINLALQKAKYNKANECTLGDVKYKFYNMHRDANTKTIENYARSILKKQQHYLINNPHLVSPEVYLACFWDNQLLVADELRKSPRDISTNYRQYKRDDLPSDKELEFESINEIFHADNDLMSFSAKYDRYLRDLVHFYLIDKMKKVSGRGNRFFTNEFYDQYHENILNYAQIFFTGRTQESLCFNNVLEAFPRTSWSCYNKLYQEYTRQYPHSLRIEILKNHHIKAATTSPGKTPYDFTLYDINGDIHKLSDYKGQAVHIAFMPIMEKIYNRYGNSYINLINKYTNENITFLIVSYSDKQKTIDFFKENDYDATCLITKGQGNMLKNEYAFTSFPHFCLINANGKIVASSRVNPSDLLDNPDIIESAMLYNDTPTDYKKRTRALSIVSLVLLITIVISSSIFLYIKKHNKRQLKLAKLNEQLRESELKAIRAQMNPHFMHNCLNAIQNLVQKKELDKAHQYISKFATLIRDTLTLSDKDEISLSQEIEMINNYVALEQLRFPLDFKIEIAPEIDIYSIFIPPMLLQPSVENAIIHGLLKKEGDKKLKLSVFLKGELIVIHIVDNGIGRVASLAQTSNGTGKGSSFTQERLELLKKRYGRLCDMNISDQYDDLNNAIGTTVEITIEDEA